MAQTPDSVVLWANLALKEIQSTWIQKNPPLYPQYVETYKTNLQNTQIGTEADFATFAPIAPGQALIPVQTSIPYVGSYATYKRGVIYEWDNMLTEMDIHNRIPAQSAKLLHAAHMTIEGICASMINLANTTAISTPDGVALASTAHPLASGTYSNYDSGNALSEANFLTAIGNMRLQPSYQGIPMNLMGPFDLHVPPALEGFANKLFQSYLVPSDANNAVNWAGTQIRKIIANPFYTSTTFWGIVSSRNNPLNLLQTAPIRMRTGFQDGRLDSSFINCTMMNGVMVREWRGTCWGGA